MKKSHGVLPNGGQPLGDRLYRAFKGTLVTPGRATGLVVATGAKAELGRIAALLGETTAPPAPQQQPVIRTAALSGADLGLCCGLAALVFIAAEAEKAWQRRC